MTEALAFLAGVVIGWRAPVFVENYRWLRPQMASPARTVMLAALATVGLTRLRP